MLTILMAAPNEDQSSLFTVVVVALGSVGAIGSALVAFAAKISKSRREDLGGSGEPVPRVESLGWEQAGAGQSTAPSDFSNPAQVLSFDDVQQSIYALHHEIALVSAARYAKAAYISFVVGVLIVFGTAVLFLSGVAEGSLVSGIVALLDLGLSALFGKIAQREQVRADRKLERVTAFIDRKTEMAQRVSIAERIQSSSVRDAALAQLVVAVFPPPSEVSQSETAEVDQDAGAVPLPGSTGE